MPRIKNVNSKWNNNVSIKDEDYKKCSRCGERKSKRHSFYKDMRAKDSYSGTCKTCNDSIKFRSSEKEIERTRAVLYKRSGLVDSEKILESSLYRRERKKTLKSTEEKAKRDEAFDAYIKNRNEGKENA